MTYAIVIVALVIAFGWWRYTSVGRGMRQRDERILRELDEIGNALAEGESVSEDEIEELAERPELRIFLRRALFHLDKLELFPKRFISRVAEGEAALAYWMMHPNEFGDPPAEMSLVKTCRRVIAGKPAEFLVYAFRTAKQREDSAAHLGLAGPFFDDESPYERSAVAFSRASDCEGAVDPEVLVDWYVEMAIKKGALRA